MSGFVTALKRSERVLTVRVLDLEKRLLGAGPTVADEAVWTDYVWTVAVLTMVAQATGSAPASIATALARTELFERYRAGARRPPPASPVKE
jgi:hypothetical protein